MSADAICRNCGAPIGGNFCANCGQSAKTDIPRFTEMVHESVGAIFSYDGRVWRTIRVLVAEPGELTVAYISGQRARFIAPAQLFFWLETITFLAHRLFFDSDVKDGDAKSKELLILGVLLSLVIAFVYYPRRKRFVEHLVCATHLWAFLMLMLLAEYCFMPILNRLTHGSLMIGQITTVVAEVAMFTYSVFALSRVYNDSKLVAFGKTVLIFVLCLSLDWVVAKEVLGGSRFV